MTIPGWKERKAALGDAARAVHFCEGVFRDARCEEHEFLGRQLCSKLNPEQLTQTTSICRSDDNFDFAPLCLALSFSLAVMSNLEFGSCAGWSVGGSAARQVDRWLLRSLG